MKSGAAFEVVREFHLKTGYDTYTQSGAISLMGGTVAGLFAIFIYSFNPFFSGIYILALSGIWIIPLPSSKKTYLDVPLFARFGPASRHLQPSERMFFDRLYLSIAPLSFFLFFYLFGTMLNFLDSLGHTKGPGGCPRTIFQKNTISFCLGSEADFSHVYKPSKRVKTT